MLRQPWYCDEAVRTLAHDIVLLNWPQATRSVVMSLGFASLVKHSGMQ